MKSFNYFGLILSVLVVALLLSCNSKTTKVTARYEPIRASTNSQGNSYKALRALAHKRSDEAITIVVPESDQTVVYAILMEWNQGNGIVTLHAFSNGQAYISLGDSTEITDDGENDNVRFAVARYIAKGQADLGKAYVAESSEPPASGSVRFVLLTNQGHFIIRETMNKFDDGTSPVLLLFEEANNVITALRMTKE